MKDGKIIVIGLDGATWDLLYPWIKNDELPTFKKLVNKGSYGILESTVPHITPPAWTSMTTGKNPAKHGIFDFIGVEKDVKGWNLNLYTSLNKKSKEIWDHLDRESIITNVPLTYPPRKINGKLITGMFTPSTKSKFTYPEKLKEELLELIPNYKIELDLGEYRGKKQQFLEDLYKMSKERIKLFWYLFQMKWDFFFFVFTGTDRVQHIIWKEAELLRYYKYLDNFLEKVLESIGRDKVNLFLVSDHGFTQIKKCVYINSILRELGYLKLKKSYGEFRGNLVSKESVMRFILKYSKLYSFYKKLPPTLLHLIRKIVPGSSNPVYDFDLDNSDAFMIGTGSIYVTVNNDTKRRDIENKIVRELESLRNPDTGEKIINKVYKKNELYSGDLIDKAPDLIILPNKGYAISHEFSDSSVKDSFFKKADHALDGIFLAYGPDIKEGGKIEAKIYDVAPTILHMFGLPIPNDMDGRVLKEIFKEDSEPAQRGVSYQKVDTEKEKVKDKIGGLRKSGKL